MGVTEFLMLSYIPPPSQSDVTSGEAQLFQK